MISPEQLNTLIRSRRAVFPASYSKRPIERNVLEEILENANWAPTHKRTEPWRFKVFSGAALQRLAGYLGDAYKAQTPPEFFSEIKYRKTIEKPLQSACVIAICMQRDPQSSLPEWEEMAAVACAVQNMWLSCTAYGIGAYWSTPGSILKADDFLGLKAGERCLGLFYMGYVDGPIPEGKRNAIADKVEWIES